MKWFLYVFSLTWIVCGSCMILYTAATRKTFKEMLAIINPRATSIVAAILGIVFMVAASASHNPWVIRLIGIIALLKGALFFFNPGDVWQKAQNLFIKTFSDQTYRLLGIVIVIFGTAILSWIV